MCAGAPLVADAEVLLCGGVAGPGTGVFIDVLVPLGATTPEIAPDRPLVGSDELINRAAKIATAYGAHNALSVGDLTRMLGEVHQALRALATPPEAAVARQLHPAVPIRNSVTPDFIICLEDGRKFK